MWKCPHHRKVLWDKSLKKLVIKQKSKVTCVRFIFIFSDRYKRSVPTLQLLYVKSSLRAHPWGMGVQPVSKYTKYTLLAQG